MVLLFVPIKKYLLFVCVFKCSILIPVLTIADVLVQSIVFRIVQFQKIDYQSRAHNE